MRSHCEGCGKVPVVNAKTTVPESSIFVKDLPNSVRKGMLTDADGIDVFRLREPQFCQHLAREQRVCKVKYMNCIDLTLILSALVNISLCTESIAHSLSRTSVCTESKKAEARSVNHYISPASPGGDDISGSSRSFQSGGTARSFRNSPDRSFVEKTHRDG